MTNHKELFHLIPPYGGYRDLQSYQMAEIAINATAVFRDCSIGCCTHTILMR